MWYTNLFRTNPWLFLIATSACETGGIDDSGLSATDVSTQFRWGWKAVLRGDWLGWRKATAGDGFDAAVETTVREACRKGQVRTKAGTTYIISIPDDILQQLSCLLFFSMILRLNIYSSFCRVSCSKMLELLLFKSTYSWQQLASVHLCTNKSESLISGDYRESYIMVGPFIRILVVPRKTYPYQDLEDELLSDILLHRFWFGYRIYVCPKMSVTTCTDCIWSSSTFEAGGHFEGGSAKTIDL